MGRPDDQEDSRLLSDGGPSSVSDFQDEPPTPTSEEPDDLLDFSGSASANVPASGGPAPHIVTGSSVDLPPSYSEISDPIASTSLNSPAHDADTLPSPPSPPNLFKKDTNTGREYYMDHRLDTDPSFLEQCVRYWVTLPPRQYMRVKGQHRETVRRDNKSETKWITDFEIKVEITPYLYRDPERLISMAAPRTVEQHEKTRRGTACRRYGSGYKKRRHGSGPVANADAGAGAHGRIELGAEEENAGSAAAKKPNLTEWCHLYCASHASLKTFSIRKKVVGLDTERLKMRLETLVRDTNYRGDVVVDFPTTGDQVEVYSACKTNEWRLTTWIRVLFSCLLLIIFTWPYLFLTTKRFEVVVVEWPFSRYHEQGSTLEYASITEEQLFNLWSRAVHQAVMSKRICTLDQQDLVDPDGRPLVQTGSQALDTLVGAGVRAMNEVNRQLGWGRHSGSRWDLRRTF